MPTLIVDGRPVTALEVATTARARSKGLLGRTGLAGALWLAPARQVHTFRMRFTIDVAYLDKDGRAIHVATMPPGRLGPWRWAAKGVVEAEGGAFEQWGLRQGSRVEIDLTSPASA